MRVELGGATSGSCDPLPVNRVDEADSGQVEQGRHSVRPCRIERRAQAVRGTPVELVPGFYEAGLLERLHPVLGDPIVSEQVSR
jgi:hypothetical protein